jgi:hypothetical protein
MNPHHKEPPMAISPQPLNPRKSASDTHLNRPTREAQLGWAAGFLDGEGCIHIVRQRYRTARADTYRLAVQVGQNDLDALEYFRAVVGIDAPIYEVKLSENHRRQCYTLNYSGKRALQLIMMLTPYLRRKRREAQAAQAFWNDGRVGQTHGGKPVDPTLVAIRAHYFDLLKRLK